MIRLASPKSHPAAALCLTCQASHRWEEHLEVCGTPPDPSDFLALWPHADFYQTRTILAVLAISEEPKRSKRLGILCDCTVAMRREYEQRLHQQLEHESAAPDAGNAATVPATGQHQPVPSVPRFALRWRHLAAACIGLVVVIAGAIGWHELFNEEIRNSGLLAGSGQYAALLEEWEAGAFARLEDSVITRNGHEVVSFDLLDKNTGGPLSLVGIESGEPVDAEVARDLLKTYHDTVRTLVGKTDAEVLEGLDSLFLELDAHPAWARLKYATHPPRQLLLRAAQKSTDRDK